MGCQVSSRSNVGLEEALFIPRMKMEGEPLSDDDRKKLSENPKMWTDTDFYPHYLEDFWDYYAGEGVEEVTDTTVIKKIATHSVDMYLDLLEQFIRHQHNQDSDAFIMQTLKQDIPVYLPGKTREKAIQQTMVYLITKLDKNLTGTITKKAFMVFFPIAHKPLFTFKEIEEDREHFLKTVREIDGKKIVNELKAGKKARKKDEKKKKETKDETDASSPTGDGEKHKKHHKHKHGEKEKHKHKKGDKQEKAKLPFPEKVW